MSEKPKLNADKIARIDQVREVIVAARESLVNHPKWTTEDRELMLLRVAEVHLPPAEQSLVGELIRACLSEYQTDADLRPFIGPGVQRADLESLLIQMEELLVN